MPVIVPPRRRPFLLVTAVAMLAASDAGAIEMFTYFGDGSRIGLPSLEVPVEAYPGIPLRSDRLRARRRAMRMNGGQRMPAPGYTSGITIRAVPAEATVAIPAAGGSATAADAPLAPEPADDVTPSPSSPSP